MEVEFGAVEPVDVRSMRHTPELVESLVVDPEVDWGSGEDSREDSWELVRFPVAEADKDRIIPMLVSVSGGGD